MDSLSGNRVFVAGHRGLVGSAIVRALRRHNPNGNLLVRTRNELDLRDSNGVESFFDLERPDVVFVSAAKVGGILANSTFPVDFIQDNLQIQTNLISSAFKYGVERLLFLGSSCIYPKYSSQPIREEYLLTGELEPTNQPYAIAKIAGIELVNAYRRQYGARFVSAMPTNLYGPRDNFDLETSHVLPALIRKMHDAKISGASAVTVWGTGTPRREFLHVDDLAEACLFLIENYDEPFPINVGVGEDISIGELAELVRDVVGFNGVVVYDKSKPDGTPRKLLDVSRINQLGWKSEISLRDGIESVYEWYLQHAT